MGYNCVTVKHECIIDVRDLQSSSTTSQVGKEDLSYGSPGMGASSSKQVGKCEVTQFVWQGGNQGTCLIGLARIEKYHLKPSGTPSE